MTYRIDLLSKTNLPLIRKWLQETHVQEWWSDPKIQYDLISADLTNPAIDLHLVSCGDTPFAYLQDYCVQDWMQPHLTHLPLGTRAIDMFIGDPQFLGQGHGARFLRQHALTLRDFGAPQVVIDPDPTNKRAVRTYRKAGFKDESLAQSNEGPVLLMIFDPGLSSR